MPKTSRSAGGSKTAPRRRQAIIGATGLAVVLGAGGIAVAVQRSGEPPQEVVVAQPAPTPTKTTKSTATPTTKPTAEPTRTPAKSTADRVKAAKEAGQDHGVPVTGPILRPAADPNLVISTNDWILKKKQRIQVVYARGDLTGQKQLAWVVDDGEPFRDASCTHKTQLSDAKTPTERPNLLLCWRTSAAKSVYTLTIDLDGHPSKADSVAALDKQWNLMD
jgi:hypothetical protein